MEKYQWYHTSPTVPASRYLTKPKDLTPTDLAILKERVQSFHEQIADLGDRWEEAGPLPPFSKASALTEVVPMFPRLIEQPFDLTYYDFPPAFHGRGWANEDPRFPPEYLEPQVEWTKMLTLDLQKSLRNPVSTTTIHNHCLYYGLCYYSFLNFIREDMPEVKNIPMRLRGGSILDRVYLSGERAQMTDAEAVLVFNLLKGNHAEGYGDPEWLHIAEDHVGISWERMLERKGDMEKLAWERKQKEMFSGGPQIHI